MTAATENPGPDPRPARDAFHHPDVVVVGAGPGGLMAATHLARSGLETVVLEKREPPLDKACGEGILGPGVEALRRLGIEPAEIGRPFEGITYIDGNTRVHARLRRSIGLGCRRIRLVAKLQQEAVASGAAIHHGAAVRSLLRSDATGHWSLETPMGTLSPRWIVAADGLHSPIRKRLRLAGREPGRRRFGLRSHRRLAPWSSNVEVYWSDGVEAYVTPVADDEVGIAFLFSPEHLPGPLHKASFEGLLGCFPQLASRLGSAPVLSAVRGAGPLAQPVREVARDNVLLLGDAAGYLDAITGEGLSVAFEQAEALGHWSDRWSGAAADLRSDWRRVVRGSLRVPLLVTRLALLLSRHPHLRRAVLRRMERRPEVFEQFVEALGGGGGGALRRAGGGLLGELCRPLRRSVRTP